MKHFKNSIPFILFVSILIFTGCQQKDSIVQPTNNNEPSKTLSGSESPLTQNAFTNGDMENGTDGYWHGGNFSNASYTFIYSDSEYVSPSHSLGITGKGSSNNFAYWAQTINAVSFVGKKISVTVNTKYSNVEGDGVILAIRGDDTDTPEGSAEAFSTTEGKVALNGTSDWKTIKVDLDPVPKGIKSLTVYMLISSKSGSVYFDDLNLTESEASPPINDITNGNMESGNYSPDYWWYGSADNSLFNFAWDSSEYLSANHSLKISSEGSEDHFAIWAQTISASELIGKKITLNVNIKAQNLTGQGVYIAIRGDDTPVPLGSAEQFTTTQGNEQITGSFDWKKFSVTLNNVQSSMKSFTFYLIYGTNTSGTAFFDNVSLTKE